ncbi:MAG: MoaD/ThiS family protein [Dehalococcoidia bacterium]|nr:MoaD/ThiS family protein [Dehalococcoidia bacterium]
MSVRVRIPTPLRKLSNGSSEVMIDCTSIANCVSDLESQYPGFRERLCDEAGELRRFVNIYVNGEDVRFLDGLATPTKSGDEISIVPAVAGGR